MKFEIDVSGPDIFNDDYVICIADGEGVIKGFKFNRLLSDEIVQKWLRGKYRYKSSASKQGIFKVRLYCIIIYNLFKQIEDCKEVDLCICRDFQGRENEITQNLYYFLEKIGKIKIKSLKYGKLPNDSDAHWYAYMMHKDKYNKLHTYTNIKIEEIECFLHKPKVISKGRKTES